MANEYLVSAPGTGDNRDAQLVRLAGGGYAALWVRERPVGQSMLDERVMLRLLDGNGNGNGNGVGIGAPIGLGPGGDGFEQPGAIAVAALGTGFVLVRGLDGDQFDNAGSLLVTRHDANGAQIGSGVTIGEVDVDPAVSRDGGPAVVALANGGFLVGWDDGGTATILAFSADGVPAAAPTALSAPSDVFGVSLDRIGDGHILATWRGTNPDNVFTRELRGRMLDGNGVPIGEAFDILSLQGDDVTYGGAALLDDGSYVVTFQIGRFEPVIQFARFTAGGQQIGDVMTASSAGRVAEEPAILALPGRGFVIAWRDFDPATQQSGIFAQTFNREGGKIAFEFAISTGTSGSDRAPDLALAANKRVVALWSEGTFDGQFRSDIKASLIDYTQGIDLFGTAAADRLDGTTGQDVLIGGGGNDLLIGGFGDDRLAGGEGDDVLRAGPGRDGLEGGAGNDLYVVSGELALIVERADGGYDTVSTDSYIVLPDHVEALQLTGTADASLGGNDLANSIIANVGDNFIQARGGDDIVYGRDGDDSISGGDGADRLFGEAGGDLLLGGAGNDILDGGAGADTTYGGTGDDIYIVDDDGFVNELADEGDDIVFSSHEITLRDHIERLTLTGTLAINGVGNASANLIVGNDAENGLRGEDGDDRLDGLAGDDRLSGGAGRDTLIGRDGDDELDGGAGADLMSGGAGNDVYQVDDVRDSVSEAADGGFDTVDASTSHTLFAFVEDLSLLGDAATGRGNDLNNRIWGSEAANSLVGLGGRDMLAGGGGDDALLGGADNDILFGGSGNDRLDGGTGADDMEGRAGNDNYVVDDANDQVRERVGEGIDTVQSSLNDYTLPDHVERLELIGSAASSGQGNALANLLIGNAAGNFLTGGDGADQLEGNGGADTLRGGTGDDVLRGGAGDDRIEGGQGADTLYGGAGADRFVVGPGDVGGTFALADRIADFSASDRDRIDLSAVDADRGAAGDQAFRFIGSAVFSGAAGELRAVTSGGAQFVFGDTDGDRVADLMIAVTTPTPLTALEFAL